MNTEGFERYLKSGGRSPRAIERCLRSVAGYQEYLAEHRGGVDLAEAGWADLEAFVAWIEEEPKASAKTHLWAIGYYYAYTCNEEMQGLASALRQQRIKRRPFALRDFRGVEPDYVAGLAAAGIRDVDHMLAAGRTAAGRQALAAETGVPPQGILEFVRLSDLARIPGIKGVRARLYYDAGVDSVEKLATWEPEALRAMLVEFVQRTGFEGTPPLPREAAFSVAMARRLPQIIVEKG